MTSMTCSAHEPLLDRACAELERRLRAGQARAAEDVLAVHGLLIDPDCALQLIYEELVQRERLGERPEYEEYYQRFPQWRDELRKSFEVHEALVRGASPTDVPAATAVAPGEGVAPAKGAGTPRFELLQEIGRGGMGVVYEARQPGLNRIVALKMILGGELAGAAEQARFAREAETAARLQHPNIVQVYEVGQQDGRPFLAMEHVAGGNLADRLREALPSPVDAARLVETLARAVHHAHEQGVLHRDLKPANILLQIANCKLQIEKSGAEQSEAEQLGFQSAICNLQSAIPKITDFGLAKICRNDEASAGNTHTGAVLGTPSYMAPEQAAGQVRAIGPHTDIHALGSILYELITGRPPFRAATALETLEQVRTHEPARPAQLQPGLPRDLQTICLKCLRKEPAQRYASALELAEDLRRFLAGEPIRARPISAAGRAWKWCRRRPVIAGLLATIFLISSTSVAVIVWQWQAERTQRELVEESLAANQVLLARQHWLVGEVDRAKEVLEACPLRYRNREWQQIDRHCNAQLFHFKSGQEMYHVAWSPDGRYLFGTNGQRVTSQWEAATGRHVKDWATGAPPAPPGTLGTIAAKAFPVICDGVRLRYLDMNSRSSAKTASVQVVTIDLASDVRREQLIYQGARPGPFGLSPDGRRFAIEADTVMTVHDLSTEPWTAQVLPGRLPAVHGNGVRFSPDNGRLARFHAGAALVWDLQAGKLAHSLRKERMSSADACFSARGRWLALAGADHSAGGSIGRIVVWDMITGKEALTLSSTVANTGAWSAAFTPDERWLAWQGSRHEIVLSDVASGSEVFTLRGHQGLVMSMCFSPDGARLATASMDKTMRIWDVRPLD